jgi:hypothetical protein
MLPQLTIRPRPSQSPNFGLADWTCAELTPAVAWNAALASVRAMLAGCASDLAKVMVDGEIVKDPADLPGAGDRTHDDWFARIRAAAGPEASILFYARDMPRHDRRFFEILLAAASGLFPTFGLARRPVDMELFCGRYGATPGGIHREFCANNHLVLAGRKVMHFWDGDGWIPPDVERDHFDGPVGEADEEYLSSVAIESVARYGAGLPARAGEMFNWANGVWHVGESRESALALNFARYMSSFDVGEEGFTPQFGADGRVDTDWLTAYQEFLTGEHAPDGALAIASCFGIAGAEPSETDQARPAVVTRTTPAPLLWCPDGPDVLVATHGRVRRFALAEAASIEEIGGLGPGKQLTVRAGVKELVAWLVANSALTAAGAA